MRTKIASKQIQAFKNISGEKGSLRFTIITHGNCASPSSDGSLTYSEHQITLDARERLYAAYETISEVIKNT